MRFLTLVKCAETLGPPPQALLAAIGELGQEAAAAGVLVETGGLLPTAAGARVRVEGGTVSVAPGPFSEVKEPATGYAVFNVRSREDAIAWSRRFMAAHKEHWPGWVGETEIRQIMDFPKT